MLCLGEFSSAGHMTDKGGGFLAYSGCAVEIWWRFQACQSQKGLWIKRALKKKTVARLHSVSPPLHLQQHKEKRLFHLQTFQARATASSGLVYVLRFWWQCRQSQLTLKIVKCWVGVLGMVHELLKLWQCRQSQLCVVQSQIFLFLGQKLCLDGTTSLGQG